MAGLGRAFLRHIERCRILVHVVDATSNDPLGDFEAINAELALFSPWLAKKPQAPRYPPRYPPDDHMVATR